MGKKQQMRRERRQGNKAAPGDSELRVGHWAIAFLDLMGYGAALEAFDVFPLPRDKTGQDALTAKIVRPRNFRRRLVGGLKSFIESNSKAQLDLSHFPPDFQRLAARWRALRINSGVLGDAVFMEVALKPDDRHFPARALDTMLAAACSASLLQLAVGANDPEDTLPLRGGIDVGAGATIDGQLYSAALKKAVVLEGEAVFPRILIGARLAEYVEHMATNPGDDMTAEYIRTLMSAARGFFFEDPTDGKLCLDFLGPQFHRRTGGDRALALSAQKFVQKALGHFKDDNLLDKYRWLDKYMASRSALWDLK